MLLRAVRVLRGLEEKSQYERHDTTRPPEPTLLTSLQAWLDGRLFSATAGDGDGQEPVVLEFRTQQNI